MISTRIACMQGTVSNLGNSRISGHYGIAGSPSISFILLDILPSMVYYQNRSKRSTDSLCNKDWA